MCLPLLIFPCTIKSRSSLLAPAHSGGPGKRAVKWLWQWRWWCCDFKAECTKETLQTALLFVKMLPVVGTVWLTKQTQIDDENGAVLVLAEVVVVVVVLVVAGS